VEAETGTEVQQGVIVPRWFSAQADRTRLGPLPDHEGPAVAVCP